MTALEFSEGSSSSDLAAPCDDPVVPDDPDALVEYQQLLPNGCEKRLTPGGRPYYVDHNRRVTSWVKPSASDDPWEKGPGEHIATLEKRFTNFLQLANQLADGTALMEAQIDSLAGQLQQALKTQRDQRRALNALKNRVKRRR